VTSVPGQMEFDLSTDMVVRYPLIESPEPGLDLPPFSGKDAHCSKCGDNNVRIDFHAGMTTHKPCAGIWYRTPPEVKKHYAFIFPEHMDRRCTTCNYEWSEDINRSEGL
jgi:hypothetical protein